MLTNGFNAQARIIIALVLFLLMGVLLLVQAFVALAAPPSQTPEDGQAVFQQLCTSCHTLGQGDLVGPDLEGVTTRREQEWLTRWLLAPDEMLAQQDPIAVEMLARFNNIPMPNFGLSETDVANLIAYFETPNVNVSTTTVPPQATISTGDPVIGKNLFTGTSRFEAGGPPCLACHTTAGIGALGGGALGPDLTGAEVKLGAALVTWPETVLPMRPIYAEKALTEDEKRHLLAFLKVAPLAQRSAEAIWLLIGLAVAGVAIFLGLSHLIWRKRIHKIRQPMVARQRTRG